MNLPPQVLERSGTAQCPGSWMTRFKDWSPRAPLELKKILCTRNRCTDSRLSQVHEPALTRGGDPNPGRQRQRQEEKWFFRNLRVLFYWSKCCSDAPGAPIRMGWASPLRVATGGDANCGSEGRRRRSPAQANRRRDVVHPPLKRGRCECKTVRLANKKAPEHS